MQTRRLNWFTVLALAFGVFGLMMGVQARPATTLASGWRIENIPPAGAVSAAGAAVVVQAAAQAPAAANTNTNVFNYQGVLRKPDGTLANGTYSMTFQLYDVVVAGSARFTDTIPAVVARDGLFNVLLGDGAGNPIGNDVIALPLLYLGIKVGNDPEMQPRQRIYSVPRAITLIPNAYINGGISVWSTNADGSPTHDPAIIEMYPRIGNGPSYAIGTEANFNRYGPAGDSSATIGHKFYVRPNEVAAQIGRGEASQEENRLISSFFGNVIFEKQAYVVGTLSAFGDAQVSGNLKVNGNIQVDSIQVGGGFYHGGRPAVLVNILSDDCHPHPNLGCPGGYKEAGKWHVSNGNCTDITGYGYDNGQIAAGWMVMCVVQ